MSKNSPLLILNSQLALKSKVYSDSNAIFSESFLSDDLQALVKQKFDLASSKALFSADFENTFDSASEIEKFASASLASSPFNFLQALDYSRINTVLDLSADLGGVAHFIADNVGPVDSVKADPALAELSAVRCANKPNVRHFCAKLNELSLPEAQYDLIIIGQLEKLDIAKTELADTLAKLRTALTPNGVLLINAANQAPLTKLLNRGTQGLPYAQIYNSQQENTLLHEVTRKDFRNALLANNFAKVSFHATFSQQSDCQNLFSEDYLTASVNALNHFHRLGYLDNPELSEQLLFKRLIDEKQNLVDLASRFVVIAGVNTETANTLYNNDFSYFANTARKPQWRSNTQRARSATQVEKINRAAEIEQKSPLLQQNLSSSAFYKGPLLVNRWLDALHQNDHQRLSEYITTYYQWLSNQIDTGKSVDHLIDALPHNIVVNERSDEYQLIDLEWHYKDKLSANYVLFRALFWFSKDNAGLFKHYAQQNHLNTVGDFIAQHLVAAEQSVDLSDFIQQEQDLQSEILLNVDKNFVADVLYRPLTAARHNNAGTNDLVNIQNRRLREYQADSSNKDQRIADLQEHRDDLLKMVKKIEQRVGVERNLQGNLYTQIEHLEARLNAQHGRNDELHAYLLMRPSTRIKRYARSWLNRLRGTPPTPPEPLQHATEAATPEPKVFPDIPEGELIAMNTEDYGLWIQENTLSNDEIARAKADIEAMPYKPVFSILVPIYNTDPEYLLPMIESVQNQIYPYWQLCLVDDCSPKTYLKRILEQQAIDDERISIKLNDINQGISVTTNDALSIATGDYIALLDHDDEITIDALYENAKLINARPEVGLIYSDEDKMELDGTRLEPYFKPDYSPDLLDTNNYICHFTVIKKSIMQSIGGFREGLDGSQDHDVILRAARVAKEVAHIPRILYHWRKIPGSTAVEYDSKSYAWEAGRKAIEDLHRQFEDGVKVEFGTLKGSYRLRREIIGEPLVSIVIPFKDKPELLDSCLNSILNRSSYQNFEIVGVSNNSEQTLTHERMAHFSAQDPRVRFVEHNVPFNFSAICNYGVEQTNGDYIVLLNNDIEIITPDWIESMLEHAQREQVGAVGCKLLFPDGRIQHAGVVAGMVGAAGHTHKLFPNDHIGFHGRLYMVHNVSAVTGAMLMMAKNKFQKVGALDADNLAVAYNDIDLCLKLIEQEYYNVITPYAVATHHESVSRGYEDTDEKRERLKKEQTYFLSKWSDFLAKGDPFYNPNMSLKNERYSLKFKD